MTRRLAAILAADVVGYSKLMSADQDGALAALRRLRSEVFGPAVASKRGKIVKSMGDGWLVAFDSAADAVTCAMQVQDRLAEEPAIKLRIGVHTGDIIEEEEDVFGDGVNIAARLEGISAPGGVAISDAVWIILDGTLKPSFDDQGVKALKNIDHPVKVWARGGEVAGGVARAKGIPHIAIAPISTTSENPEVMELAAAVTGDLTAFIGTSNWLQADITETVNSDEYAFRGALRSRGDRIRLEVALTSPNGALIWSEKYDGSLQNSFDWQDQTGEVVATHLFGQVLAQEELMIEQTPEAQRTAEQWFAFGMLRSSQDIKGLRHALWCMEQCMRLRPDWGRPYVQGLAALFAAMSLGLGKHFADYAERQPEWLQKAEALEPKASPAQALLAFAEYVRTGDTIVAGRTISTLLRHLPFDPDVLMFGGYLSLYCGEPQLGLDCMRKLQRYAMRTPYAAATLNGISFGCAQLGDFETAIKAAEAALAINPEYYSSRRHLVAAFAALGRQDEAATQLAMHEAALPGESITSVRDRVKLADTEHARRYLDALRLAGMPE